MEEAERKIRSAKVQIAMQYPFYGVLCLNLKQKEEKRIQTIGVSKMGECAYNPEFINNLTPQEVNAVVLHEALHMAFNTAGRSGNRDKTAWNVASDLVINNILVKTFGVSLPSCGLIPQNNSFTHENLVITRLNEKTAEQVYSELPKGKEQPNGFDLIPEDISEEMQEEWKQVLIQATITGKESGTMPKEFERTVDSLLHKKRNWIAEIQRFITHELKCGLSYRKPHKKGIPFDLILPTAKRENIFIAGAVDVSGSITEDIIKEFNGNLIAIAKSHPNLRMTLYFCDASIHGKYPIDNGNIKKIREYKPVGGGGTDFRPVFKDLEQEKDKPKALIYLTDGEGTYPAKETIPTIWVVKGDYKPPFGRRIEL